MSPYLGLLRNRSFVIYWTGSTIVQLGLQFSTIALIWFVLQTTGSATRIGIILALFPLSRMVTSPFIGFMIDRLPRRELMVFDNLIQAVLYLLIPVFQGLHLLSFPVLMVIVLLAGALSPLSMIGRGVILPNIVPSEDLEVANGFSQIRMSFVSLFGPALGGVLVGFFGAPVTLIITVVCYALYVVSLLFIPASRFMATYGQDDESTTLVPQLNGWQYLYRIPLLLLLVIVTLFFNLTYGPLEPALPVLVSRVFHAGASTLGLIWSSFAVGALFGTFLWSRFRPNWTLRVVISGIIFCWGVFSGGIGLAAHPWQAMVMMFFGGVTFAPYNILAATWEQWLISDQHRGKVYGVIQSITSVGLPIGQLAGGFMVKGIGASATILVGGIATVLLGIVVISLRGLWRTSH